MSERRDTGPAENHIRARSAAAATAAERLARTLSGGLPAPGGGGGNGEGSSEDRVTVAYLMRLRYAVATIEDYVAWEALRARVEPDPNYLGPLTPRGPGYSIER